jgi:Holliday junction DNA helicase RuvA
MGSEESPVIAWLEGVLREKLPTRVVVDVRGVGYALHVPLSTFAALPDTGKNVSMHVHTHVRDDALLLYGFATAYEREAFELLLRANRVGPKLAQTILSGIAPGVLVGALRRGEVKVLRGVPGIGPKMAERMAVELREPAEALQDPGDASIDPATSGRPAAADEALSALLNLGYPRAQAERTVEVAVEEAGDEADIETLIRMALKGLAP